MRFIQYQRARHASDIVICVFRRPGLSADDRTIAVLNSAFGVFSGVFRQFRAAAAKSRLQPATGCIPVDESINEWHK
jgi:hypothetical protein